MADQQQIDLLREFVGASSDVSDDALAESWDRAASLVDLYVGSATVPPAEIEGSTKEVAAELHHRKSAPNGVSQFADGQGNPVRIARDPMVAAYRTLAPYVGLGIG